MPNGIITHYTLYINYNNGTIGDEKRQVGSETLYLLGDLSPHQTVSVRISASTIAGEGPISGQVLAKTNQQGKLLYL